MSSYIRRKSKGDTDWFVHDRFGMFIHWGLYSMPARHEWLKSRECLTEEHYDKFFKYFNPDMYDPKDWAKRAKDAGMKYAVFTTKHHEGFCMFDSKYTEYKCTNTPAGRDLVKEYVDAFRAEGLKIGFYYSLIDWNHPHFPIDCTHPRRFDEDAYEQSKDRDVKIYAEYMRNQVTELLTNYGKIDIIWFDYSYPEINGPAEWMRGKGKDDWESEKLISLTRKLQPGIIIDNRSDFNDYDVQTPEQFQPLNWERDRNTGELATWEACQTFSGSWGYYRDEMTWKSPEILIQMLINTVSRGGNLLMNVGPTSRGYLDDRAKNSLNVFAEWMKYNSRSIYGCTMAEPGIIEPRGCRMTQSNDGKRLYLHVFEYPVKFLIVPNIGDVVDYAQFLHDGSEIKMTIGSQLVGGEHMIPHDCDKNVLILELPPVKPNVTVPVIELFLK